MKVTIVPIVIGALGTVTKGLLKGLEELEVGGQVQTIQTTALLRTARILRRVLETLGDCHSNSSEKPSANTDVKNSKGVNNNNSVKIVFRWEHKISYRLKLLLKNIFYYTLNVFFLICNKFASFVFLFFKKNFVRFF